MTTETRFAHVNLVARDWRRLVRFYEQVFGCVPVPPERDLAGQWLEDGTGIPGARIRGIHLRLPGHGDAGPTLEVLQYDHLLDRPEPAANRPGFGQNVAGLIVMDIQPDLLQHPKHAVEQLFQLIR